MCFVLRKTHTTITLVDMHRMTCRSEQVVAATAQASNLAPVQMPSHLPQGYTHFSLARVELVMTPLPSLSITYTVRCRQPLILSAHVIVL